MRYQLYYHVLTGNMKYAALIDYSDYITTLEDQVNQMHTRIKETKGINIPDVYFAIVDTVEYTKQLTSK